MYAKGFAGKNTEFFLADNPDEVMQLLEDYCMSKDESEEIKIQVNEKEYKATVIKGKTNVTAGIKILSVGNEEGLFCIDFTRRGGDLIDFLDLFKEIKDYLEVKLGYKEE